MYVCTCWMLSCQESKAIALYCVILISSVNVRGNQYVAMEAVLLPCGHTCGHTCCPVATPVATPVAIPVAIPVATGVATRRRCSLVVIALQPMLLLCQRRRNGGGRSPPAVLKPQGREYLFAPAIFYHILFACCALNFHCLSLCCLHTIKTSHTGLSCP